MIPTLVGAVVGLVGKAIDAAFPDATERERVKGAVLGQIYRLAEVELQGAINIILAEASGGSWLQRNWRPLTMLAFVSLIAAHWLGFTPPGLSEAERLSLLDLVKIGLGGYIAAKSMERIAPSVAAVLGK